MNATETRAARERLSVLHQNLLQAIDRNRISEKELTVEKTEDEGDLATISQNRELLYDLNESEFQRLKAIKEALKRLDSGHYGKCVRCEEDIKEKRLLAVPWAALCIQCQTETENELLSTSLVLAGNDSELEQ